ncbi:DUF5076 domain-containing protein [Brevundimonas sp.]|uniref:DUF5076 domain-containing protein n=1 Tax=Brevundimonas sp. TaxID=1871086 RepID=UPI00391A7E5C
MSEAPQSGIPTPPEILADAAAIELMRVWWSGGRPVMALKPAFEDPRNYGALLANAVHHLARTYAANTGLSETAAYRAIVEGLNQRLENPAPEGEIEALPETDA